MYVCVYIMYLFTYMYACMQEADGDSGAEDEPLGHNIYAACPFTLAQVRLVFGVNLESPILP